MNAIFSLSLSASLLVMMLYPVFHIMVNRCRSFSFNRILILLGMVIMAFAPIALTCEPINDAVVFDTSIHSNIIRTQDINTSETALLHTGTSGVDFLLWILSLYWIGVFVLGARQIISYANLWRILAKSEKQQMDGYVLCRHENKGIAPFSWGRFIVLPNT